MRRFWFGLLLCLFAAPAFAQAPAFEVVKEKSYLKFVAIQNNAPVEGRFEDYTADIRFDEKNLDQSNIVVEVKTGSVSVTHEDVAKNVKLPEWLSVDAFPTAVYKSKKIVQTPETNNYYAVGTLTLKGQPHAATLNFTLRDVDSKTKIADGYMTLRRNDYKIGEGQWSAEDVIKNEVRVEFRILAKKKSS